MLAKTVLAKKGACYLLSNDHAPNLLDDRGAHSGAAQIVHTRKRAVGLARGENSARRHLSDARAALPGLFALPY